MPGDRHRASAHALSPLRQDMGHGRRATLRPLSLAAGFVGLVVIIWEIPLIWSRTSLWPVLMLLGLGVILLAVAQIRHGGQ